MKRASIAIFAMCILAVWIGFLKAENSASRAGSQEELNPAMLQNGEQNGSVVIGYIKTRDTVVAILKTAEGSRYTIKTADGKTLDARINDEEFKARYPFLHDQIQTGRANNDAVLRIPSSLKGLSR
jgi:hypothetical protein